LQDTKFWTQKDTTKFCVFCVSVVKRSH